MGAFGVDTLLPTTCFTLRLEPNADAFGMLESWSCANYLAHDIWNNMRETLLMHVGRPVLGMRATACLDKLPSTAVHLYACVRVLSKGRTANASSKHEIPKSQIRLETSKMV